MISVSKSIRRPTECSASNALTGASGYTRKPHMLSVITNDSVSIQTQTWVIQRPIRRPIGIDSSKIGSALINAAGFCRLRSSNTGSAATSCWPSASICTAWVKPASQASRMPCMTAPPLPWLTGKRCTAIPISGRCNAAIADAAGSLLPSSMTKTGSPAASRAPTTPAIACQWSCVGTIAQIRIVALMRRATPCRWTPRPHRSGIRTPRWRGQDRTAEQPTAPRPAR